MQNEEKLHLCEQLFFMLSFLIRITLQFCPRWRLKFLFSLSPWCTWHFVLLQKNGVAKMSKLLLYHLQSLLSTVLFSCYWNKPFFIRAHILVCAPKPTRAWHRPPLSFKHNCFIRDSLSILPNSIFYLLSTLLMYGKWTAYHLWQF